MARRQRLLGLTRGRSIGLALGIAVLAAILVRAGAGSVVRSLESLRLTGLLLIVLLHVPVVAGMAGAWRSVAGDLGGRSGLKFLWARLVRDAAAEVLPFSQVGGFLCGLSALRLRGSQAVRGTISMGVDLVIELAAKLPYLIAGGLVLLALAPRSGLVRPIQLGIALTAVAVAVPVFARRRVWRLLESAVGGILRRSQAGTFLDHAIRRAELEAMLEELLGRPSRLLAGFLLHLACWVVGAAELWVVFALLGVHIGAAQALAIDSIVAGLRTFAFMIPAAAGVQEGSYVLACAAFGVPATTAVAASLARRARDLLLGGVTLGIFAIARAHGSARAARSCRDSPQAAPRLQSGDGRLHP
jgi:glycosyltransferase 2 family protein